MSKESQDQAGPPPVVLSRKERNHVGQLAALHMGWAGEDLAPTLRKLDPQKEREEAQRIAVLFHLREDLGWEPKVKRGGQREWKLSLTPPATLRGLLRRWRKDEIERLVGIDRAVAEAIAQEDVESEAQQREEVVKANRSLYRTCDLITRLEGDAVDHLAAIAPAEREAVIPSDQMLAPMLKATATGGGKAAASFHNARVHELPMLTLDEVRAARIRITSLYKAGEAIDSSDAANQIDRQADEERAALYERVLGATVNDNVEDAGRAMRIALGQEGD